MKSHNAEKSRSLHKKGSVSICLCWELTRRRAQLVWIAKIFYKKGAYKIIAFSTHPAAINQRESNRF
jgi:hypothetical protein